MSTEPLYVLCPGYANGEFLSAKILAQLYRVSMDLCAVAPHGTHHLQTNVQFWHQHHHLPRLLPRADGNYSLPCFSHLRKLHHPSKWHMPQRHISLGLWLIYWQRQYNPQHYNPMEHPGADALSKHCHDQACYCLDAPDVMPAGGMQGYDPAQEPRATGQCTWHRNEEELRL